MEQASGVIVSVLERLSEAERHRLRVSPIRSRMDSAVVAAGRELLRSKTPPIRQQLPAGYDVLRFQNAVENVSGGFCRLRSRGPGGDLYGTAQRIYRL